MSDAYDWAKGRSKKCVEKYQAKLATEVLEAAERDKATNRIEELEAKLAKAVEALMQLVVEYDEVDLAYDEPTSMTSAVNVARLITAELKGETNATE